jgi:hypothetical protein
MNTPTDPRTAALAAGVPLAGMLVLAFFLPWLTAQDATFNEIQEWGRATGFGLAVGRLCAVSRVRPDAPQAEQERHTNARRAIDAATPARPWFLFALVLAASAGGAAAAGLLGWIRPGPAGRALMLAAAGGLVLVAMAVNVSYAPARLAAFDEAFDKQYAAYRQELDERIEAVMARSAATSQPAGPPPPDRAALEAEKRVRLAKYVDRGGELRERVYEAHRTTAAPSLWIVMAGFGLMLLCGVVSGALPPKQQGAGRAATAGQRSEGSGRWA